VGFHVSFVQLFSLCKFDVLYISTNEKMTFVIIISLNCVLPFYTFETIVDFVTTVSMYEKEHYIPYVSLPLPSPSITRFPPLPSSSTLPHQPPPFIFAPVIHILMNDRG
jgi:hypothetical protein